MVSIINWLKKEKRESLSVCPFTLIEALELPDIVERANHAEASRRICTYAPILGALASGIGGINISA